MEFRRTLIYRVLSIPGEEWENNCGYVFALKVPTIFLMMCVGVPMAIIVDLVIASISIGRDA